MYDPKSRGLLQFFNLYIFQEVYISVFQGHAQYELTLIRVLETCFESAPEALVQLYFATKYIQGWEKDPLMYLLHRIQWRQIF